MHQRVAVLGASGFVGSAVSEALRHRGYEVVPVRTPRLPRTAKGSLMSAQAVIDAYDTDVKTLAATLTGLDAVVNCAGDPDASSRDVDALNRANGDVVAVIATASSYADVPRFVHVSSAVVQGRRPVLDDSFQYDPFSAYARSKIRGEEFLLSARPEGSVIYRPPSVHATGRRVTRLTIKIARSPFASVAYPPNSPTPQALLENVGDAVAFLATCDTEPPSVVIHPWEGMTTAGLLQTLSGRAPQILPRRFARSLTDAGSAVGKLAPGVAATARRLEMIWLGQDQAESWLTMQGWTPPESWSKLTKNTV